jgi:allantoin racemase
VHTGAQGRIGDNQPCVFIPYHEDQIRRHGLEQRVVAVRAIEAQVEEFNRAFDDDTVYLAMREGSVRQVRPMLALGIDIVIPAGGYPMLLFGREAGFTVDGALVLNGLPVAIAAAETAIRLLRLNGAGRAAAERSHSQCPKRSTSFGRTSPTASNAPPSPGPT